MSRELQGRWQWQVKPSAPTQHRQARSSLRDTLCPPTHSAPFSRPSRLGLGDFSIILVTRELASVSRLPSGVIVVPLQPHRPREISACGASSSAAEAVGRVREGVIGKRRASKRPTLRPDSFPAQGSGSGGAGWRASLP